MKLKRLLALYFRPFQHLELLDWAETLLCSAEKPSFVGENEWKGYVRRWRNDKNLMRSRKLNIQPKEEK